MSTNTKTLEDVRNLIVCDTQFGWTGSTTLRLPQMLALQERGWLAEGVENNEFELTDVGREVVARALQGAVQPTLADAQPGGRVRLVDRNDALAASLRQIADAQYTRRQRFNGRLPADVQKVIRMAAASLSAQPSPGAAVPAGWKLVPIEPTWSMRNDGREFLIDGIEKEPEQLAYFLWKTMINAAPEVP